MLILPEPPTESAPGSKPSPVRSRQIRWVALDAVVPGVGHLAAGRRHHALVFGIPTVTA